MFWALILGCRALEPEGDGGDRDSGVPTLLDSASPDSGSDSGAGRDSGDSGEAETGGGDSGDETGETDDSGEVADTSDVSDSGDAPDSGEGSDTGEPVDSAGHDDTDTSPVDTGSSVGDTGASPVDTGGHVDTDPVIDTGSPPVDTGSSPVDTGSSAVDTGSNGRDTSTLVDTGAGGADIDPDTAFDSDTEIDTAFDSDPDSDPDTDSDPDSDSDSVADTAVPSDTATPDESSPCVGEVVACEEPDDPSADDDADGITNDCDYCPATPSGVVVNEGGCACEGSDTFLVAPGAGNNDGTDIGSVTRAMDTFVAGTSTGGWTSTNYGDATYLLCSYGYPTGTGRCFMRFELSPIPEDASISLGTLTIYAYDVSGHGSSYGSASPRNFYASPVSAEWDEMTMTGLDQPGVDSAETSAASYCAFTDRSPCELDVATILDYLRAYGNYGFRVDDGGVHAFTRYFTSSDDSFTELAPSLEITYTVP